LLAGFVDTLVVGTYLAVNPAWTIATASASAAWLVGYVYHWGIYHDDHNHDSLIRLTAC